jgi:NADH:ubiquinone oxidoreductase subunit 5 (subunit L)/multisubunit Na+/H+ antiporter MnhA subunit
LLGWWKIPNLPFSGFYSMRGLLAKALATQRVEVALLSAMAALALLLSAVGIFALVANTVAQKTREIGIRIALEAHPERAFARRTPRKQGAYASRNRPKHGFRMGL